MEVICEGVLDFGSKPSSSSSKDWTPRLCVLRRDKETTFEFYKDTKKRWQKQVPKGTISLVPAFELSLAHNCSYQFPIKVVDGKGDTFYLSAKTHQEMNRWYNCLQRLRVLERPVQGYHEYELKPKDSQSMTLIGATGPTCLLSFTPKKEIVCANAQSRQVLGVWPFGSLRRYWHGTELFGFEAGRRSPRGEGKFEFVTSRGERLYKMLDTLTKASSPRSSRVLDTRPPAPLPPDSTPPVGSNEAKNSSRSQTLKMTSGTTEMSGPSPAYQLRRVNTTPSRTHKYLHENETIQSESGERWQGGKEVRSPPPGSVPPPPAALRGEHISTRDPGVDDTYSHTVHRMPEHFQRKAMEHSAVSGGFYNALVHRQSTSSIKLKSSGSESDELVYDIAFPPNAVNRAVIPATQEGEYAIAKHPDSPDGRSRNMAPSPENQQQRTLVPAAANPSNLRYVLTETVEKKRIDNPLYGSKEDLTDGGQDASDSGLMDNPLYGSKENLFSSPGVHMAGLTTPGNSSTGGNAASNGIDDNSLTVNPIYGTAGGFGTLSREQNGGRLGETEQTPSNNNLESTKHSTAASCSTDFQTGQVTSGEETPPSQAKSPSPRPAAGSETGTNLANRERELTPDTIQRDTKGYSKIDKNKKTNKTSPEADGKQTVEGDGSRGDEEGEDEQPPPIPPRQYSMEGESPPQSMEEQQE